MRGITRHFLWTAGVSSARPLAQADVVTLAQCAEGLSQLLTVRNRFEETAQLPLPWPEGRR